MFEQIVLMRNTATRVRTNERAQVYYQRNVTDFLFEFQLIRTTISYLREDFEFEG